MLLSKQLARKIKHHLKWLNKWLLYGLFVVSAITAIFALRANNLRMLELKNAVFVADEQAGDTEAALRALREHVASHMNSDLTSGDNAIRPPIQLKYSYERALAAEKKRVSDINARIYNDAQNDCEKRFPQGLYGSGRVPCVQEYITNNGATEKAISIDYYTFDFVSPSFTLDLAGYSIVVCLITMALIVARLIIDALLFYTLRTKQ